MSSSRESRQLLARIQRTMVSRPSCEGMPPIKWVGQLREAVSEESETESLQEVDFFKSLSDPTRLRILSLLSKKGELCVCEIQAALGQIQSLTSHHLNVLRRARVIKARKEGTWTYYSLEKGMVELLSKAQQIVKGR